MKPTVRLDFCDCNGIARNDNIRGYEFNLCFGNKATEGYTTEMLADAMGARCIPICRGDRKGRRMRGAGRSRRIPW